jgi:hypothetical protein
VGNPVDGIEVYGPFDNPGEAVEWAAAQQEVCGHDFWVTKLLSPNEEED